MRQRLIAHQEASTGSTETFPHSILTIDPFWIFFSCKLGFSADRFSGSHDFFMMGIIDTVVQRQIYGSSTNFFDPNSGHPSLTTKATVI
jgi:hypothetical protein